VNAVLLDGLAYEADPATAGMLAQRLATRQRRWRMLATFLAVKDD